MSRLVGVVVGVGLAVCGCDRGPSPSASGSVGDAPAPAADVAPAPPATKPSRPPVLMVIDEQPRQFPPAKLMTETRNGKTVAILLSDDPRQAINDDYTGNSFYLEMTFDETIDTLADRVWVYEAPSLESAEAPSAIFLEGNRKQLRPYQLKVQFERNPAGDVVWISGTCQQFLTDDEQRPPTLVPVAGRIMVKVP